MRMIVRPFLFEVRVHFFSFGVGMRLLVCFRYQTVQLCFLNNPTLSYGFHSDKLGFSQNVLVW